MVTGGRQFSPTPDVQSWFFAQVNSFKPDVILHGGADGADEWAGKTLQAAGFHVRVLKADWDRWGVIAGRVRNVEMLHLAQKCGQPLVVALPGASGTFHCWTTARAMNIAVRVYPPLVIDRFQGDYRFLSNFWPCVVSNEGAEYPTVEHAYQAYKTMDRKAKVQFQVPTAMTPGQAKRAGSKLELMPGWHDLKIGVMLFLLRQKFGPGTELADKLIATREARLIEGNSHGDVYWGMCGGEGENWLGRLLEMVRGELKTRV